MKRAVSAETEDKMERERGRGEKGKCLLGHWSSPMEVLEGQNSGCFCRLKDMPCG